MSNQESIPLTHFQAPRNSSIGFDAVEQTGYGAQPREGIVLSSRARNNFLAWMRNEKHRDQLEMRLWPQAETNNELKEFLLDYGQIKNTPGMEILSALAWFNVYQSSLVEPPPIAQDLNTKSSSLTFSECLDNLQQEIQPDGNICIRLCVLSAKLPSSVQSKLYPARARFVASVDRLRRRYRTSRFALLHVISQEWQIEEQWWTIKEHPPPTRHSRSLNIPSQATTETAFSLDNPGILSFEWRAAAPEFRNDFFEYIWQRQTEPPGFESAKVSVRTLDDGSKNICIIFSSSRDAAGSDESTRLLDLYRKSYLQPGHCSTPIPLAHSLDSEFIGAILTLLMVMIHDTGQFLVAVSRILSDFVGDASILGRRNPSGSKIHYLSHLDDCRETAFSGLTDALALLSEIKAEIDHSSRVDDSLADWSDKIKVDLLFLKNKLSTERLAIERMQAMIKGKLELRQIRRTFILTVLAAIYLPFSFMTGLFGMNLSDPLWPSTHHTNATSSVAAPSSTTASPALQTITPRDETDSLISALNQTGPHLFSFKSYWYITAPLTVATIFLPLVAGVLFRYMAQSFLRYRGYWKVILPLLFLGLSIVTNYFAPWFAYPFFGVCFGLPAILLPIRAYIGKPRRGFWMWFGYFISYVIGMVAASLIPQLYFADVDEVGVAFAYGLTGWIVMPCLPAVYLIIVWTRHDIRDVFIRFRRRFGGGSKPLQREGNLSTAEEGGNYRASLSGSASQFE